MAIAYYPPSLCENLGLCTGLKTIFGGSTFLNPKYLLDK